MLIEYRRGRMACTVRRRRMQVWRSVQTNECSQGLELVFDIPAICSGRYVTIPRSDREPWLGLGRWLRIGRWQCEPEVLAQQPHVMTVIGTRLVAEMVPQLKLRRDTADTPPCDLLRANQPTSGIGAPRAVTKLLLSVPRRVEDNRMKVDLPIVRGSENEPRW